MLCITRTNIPDEISAKLYVNFQVTWNTAMIDGEYKRNSANEAVKADKLPIHE